MKRVVLLGFLWPYISGSKRTIGLAKYLAGTGWEPIVVTAPLPASAAPPFRVVQTDYAGMLGRGVGALGLNAQRDLGEQLKERVASVPPAVKSVLRWGFRVARELVAYPDEHKGWRRHAVDTVVRLAAEDPIHGLISVWPVTAHVAAREIRERLGIPWIADLADLWSDNSAYPYGRLRRAADRRLEIATFSGADLLTTSSGPLAERLQRLHPHKTVRPIMMGFDPELLQVPADPARDSFSIVYTGMFYRGKRDPSVFLRAVSELITDGRLEPSHLAIRFYGPRADWVEKAIQAHGLGGVVQQQPPVSHDTCLALQRQAQVLLQVNWSDPAERGVFSGKFLDYLAARRPILAAGGAGADEVVAGILTETRSGVYAPSVEQIKAAIIEMYEHYRRDGVVPYRGDVEVARKYSNAGMAAQFASELDRLCRSRGGIGSA